MNGSELPSAAYRPTTGCSRSQWQKTCIRSCLSCHFLSIPHHNLTLVFHRLHGRAEPSRWSFCSHGSRTAGHRAGGPGVGKYDGPEVQPCSAPPIFLATLFFLYNVYSNPSSALLKGAVQSLYLWATVEQPGRLKGGRHSIFWVLEECGRGRAKR